MPVEKIFQLACEQTPNKYISFSALSCKNIPEFAPFIAIVNEFNDMLTACRGKSEAVQTEIVNIRLNKLIDMIERYYYDSICGIKDKLPGMYVIEGLDLVGKTTLIENYIRPKLNDRTPSYIKIAIDSQPSNNCRSFIRESLREPIPQDIKNSWLLFYILCELDRLEMITQMLFMINTNGKAGADAILYDRCFISNFTTHADRLGFTHKEDSLLKTGNNELLEKLTALTMLVSKCFNYKTIFYLSHNDTFNRFKNQYITPFGLKQITSTDIPNHLIYKDRDVSKGVPEYDPTEASEFMLLDGILLDKITDIGNMLSIRDSNDVGIAFWCECPSYLEYYNMIDETPESIKSKEKYMKTLQTNANDIVLVRG